MTFVHERNIEGKICHNYKGIGEAICRFYEDEYRPFRDKMKTLIFDEAHREDFTRATEAFNEYYKKAESFAEEKHIDSRSKFLSSFLEEINSHLFKDLPGIVSGELQVYNRGIYSGIKILPGPEIDFMKKDVDFCIGKKIDITIDERDPTAIILPVVTVEVKTYLDATMLGEIRTSSGAIRSATPSAKTYVLMGYKDFANSHLAAVRQDSCLNEMFVLRRDRDSAIDENVVYDYWQEINSAVEQMIFEEKELSMENRIHGAQLPGRLLHL